MLARTFEIDYKYTLSLSRISTIQSEIVNNVPKLQLNSVALDSTQVGYMQHKS